MTATRGGKPLAPTAEPAVGDILTVSGQKLKLVAIVSAGRGSACRYFTFADSRGHRIAVPAPKGATR